MTEPVVRQRIGDGFGGRYRVRSADCAAGAHEAPLTLLEERLRRPAPRDGTVFERFVLEKGTDAVLRRGRVRCRRSMGSASATVSHGECR